MIRRAAIAILLLCGSAGVELGGVSPLLRFARAATPRAATLRVAVVRVDEVDRADWEAAGRRTGYTVQYYDHDDLARAPLDEFHIVIIRAMGLNLNQEQLANLDRARRHGSQIIMMASTDDLAQQQTTLSKEQLATVNRYHSYGGVENLAGILHYLAHEFVDKQIPVPPVAKRPLTGFFHQGGRLFETLDDYEVFLRKERPSLPANAPRVAIFGPLLRPYNVLERQPAEYVIQALEDRGVRAYPIFGSDGCEPLLEAAKPDLAIVFPIGRVTRGNTAPELFSRLKCPCVGALALLTGPDEWMADPRGITGTWLDLQITLPELDGVIEPIAIAAPVPNEQNIRVRTPIPDRMEKRIALVLNWLKLRRTPNSQKRVVIVYYKGPGLSTLTAGGLDVVPSLFNTLKRMEAEGYDLGGKLPKSPEALFDLIQAKGKTVGQWAMGTYEKFLHEAEPELVRAEEYAGWFQQALSPKRQKETLDLWGPIPGKQMVTQRNGQPFLVVTRIRLGNIVIMPQPTVGIGKDEIAMIHGTNLAPPHFYLGAYLWARYGFKADAIVHFGTHGSLEFTNGKSCCLSRDCWPDILMGDVPHVYPYVINNIGEAMVAKRRANAVIISHLTPAFCESALYGDLARLLDKIHAWEAADNPQLKMETCKTITRMVQALDMAAEAGTAKDALAARSLSDAEIKRLHDHLHELKGQSITDGLHVIGRPLTDEQVRNTTAFMLSDQDCKTVLAAAGLQGSRAAAESGRQIVRELVAGVLGGTITPEQFFSRTELAEIRQLQTASEPKREMTGGMPPRHGGMGMHRKMPGGGKGKSEAAPGEHAGMRPMGTVAPPGGKPSEKEAQAGAESPRAAAQAKTQEAGFWGHDAASRPNIGGERQQKLAFLNVLDEIRRYGDGLRKSPQLELDRFMGALRAEYVPPSSGGDPLINPESVPTGRNLCSLSADHTPSEEAWRVGRRLAEELLAQHKTRTGKYPRRVAFTLWGGEFIRGKGTTIGEILQLIGARPVWNSRGIVNDVEIIPSKELGRPRIDVLVQTSGQFRDAAASRITLMDKAIRMVSELGEEPFGNYVREDSARTETQLEKLGRASREARELATARIFGAADNRSYGTGIMGLVEKGDTWTDPRQVADRYVQNMGGIYRDGAHWGTYEKGLLEAQMQGTEVVVQPRSSNTWGPLSLDHIYEFMGGMTLAIRTKTGVDPAGYFSDLRTPGQAKLTTAASAIRDEARTTLWNPTFLKGLQREGPQGAATLAKTVRNMYSWTVMQPSTTGQEMWDETYRVFIDDKHGLGMREYFQQKNPPALQNLTSVMLETARKGYWKPSADMLQKLAQTHAELVARFGAGCSYEACGNRKLQEFVRSQLSVPGGHAAPQLLASYQAGLTAALQPSRPLPQVKGIDMPTAAKPAAPKGAPSAQSAPKSAAAKPPAPNAQNPVRAKPVEGFQMEAAAGGSRPSASIPYWSLGVIVLFIVLFALGWRRPRRQ